MKRVPSRREMARLLRVHGWETVRVTRATELPIAQSPNLELFKPLELWPLRVDESAQRSSPEPAAVVGQESFL